MKKLSQFSAQIFAGALLLSILACGTGPSEPTAVPATDTPQPTPTKTSKPTSTPRPTSTPNATATQRFEEFN